jgi:hypothetical protein
MFRVALATFLLGSLAAGAPAAPPARAVVRGTIKDVRGIYGTLRLTLGEGEKVRERVFIIREARIVGPAGAEWKVGDLREGDRVEVEVAAGGRVVQEVRVLRRRNAR